MLVVGKWVGGQAMAEQMGLYSFDTFVFPLTVCCSIHVALVLSTVQDMFLLRSSFGAPFRKHPRGAMILARYMAVEHSSCVLYSDVCTVCAHFVSYVSPLDR